MVAKTIVIVNADGRQGAAVAFAVAAIGYQVKAHVHYDINDVENISTTVKPHNLERCRDLVRLPNVTIIVGSLLKQDFIAGLFDGAELAFVNTTPHVIDEVVVGRRLAEAARKAGVKHYIYSSMVDHSTYRQNWPGLPHWAPKFTVENYIRQTELRATFVYAGAYYNNFLNLASSAFVLHGQRDGSLIWPGPFHKDSPIPWVDTDHDFGPAVLQLFKDGPSMWAGQRIGLAFEVSSPRRVCAALACGLGRSVEYVQVKSLERPRDAPDRAQAEAFYDLFHHRSAPYWPELQAPDEARFLWGGSRSIREWAMDVLLEEMEAPTSGVLMPSFS